uniref:SHSP domain-containing protein n=1 Tax=Bursaphelenchus xylophilus TaxID=6326 RepID=A0A1I7RP65_BURXY
MLQVSLILLLILAINAQDVTHYQHVRAEVHENGGPGVVNTPAGTDQRTSQSAVIGGPSSSVSGPPAPYFVFRSLRELLDDMEANFSNFKVKLPTLSMSPSNYPSSVSIVHPKFAMQIPTASQKCDRISTIDSLKFECHVADFTPEEIHVKLNGETLKLSGYHEQPIDGGVRKIIFEESVLVPAKDYNLDDIKSFIDESNVLNVIVPKKKLEKSGKVREIAVQRN